TPKRLIGLALVAARAVNAGTMLSRSGSASVPPRPRRTVRRDKAFFVTIMLRPSSFLSCLRARPRQIRAARRRHAERRTLDDAQYDRRPAILTWRRVPRDLADRGQVRVPDAASDRERQQFFGQRSGKVFLVAGQQRAKSG